MQDSLNVLSLFDGMSCGQVALNRAKISVKTYFASEVDKFAMKVACNNYKDTIQLGDVSKLELSKLPKIDLLIGGSPCQSFSFAGKRKGMITASQVEVLSLDSYLKLKQDGFEFEGQSYLFWEFVNALYTLKPRWFLLENVVMSKKWEGIINKALGVSCYKLDSSLVSAQNRNRLYWTNIADGSRPQILDKGICLGDILETCVDSKYYLSDKAIGYITDSQRLTKKRTAIGGSKSLPLLAQYSQSLAGTFCIDSNGRIDDKKTGAVLASYAKGVERFGSRPFISDSTQSRLRKLTPLECERLQTLPDNYTQGVSDTQRYKMIGNGWTVDIISEILKQIQNG